MNDEERVACAQDFGRFCGHVRIHWLRSGPQFDLYPHQRRLAAFCEDNQFVVGVRFDKGGFSMGASLYALWKCFCVPNQRVVYCCKSPHEAVVQGRRFASIKASLTGERIDFQSVGVAAEATFDNGSLVRFISQPMPQRFTHLVVDDAAIIPNMLELWTTMYRSATQDSRHLVFSLPGARNCHLGAEWFHQIYSYARTNRNSFRVFESAYTEHPSYDQAWAAHARVVLGEELFAQNFLGRFPGEGKYRPIKLVARILGSPDSLEPERH